MDGKTKFIIGLIEYFGLMTLMVFTGIIIVLSLNERSVYAYYCEPNVFVFAIELIFGLNGLFWGGVNIWRRLIVLREMAPT